IDALRRCLQVEAARRGFSADSYVGPFDSINQELLDPRSRCMSHNPEVVFIAQELSHICPAISDAYLAMSVGEVKDYAKAVVSDLVEALKDFRKASGAAVVVHNFAISRYPLLGIHEVMSPRSQSEVIRAINMGLVAAGRSIPGVYILDYERLCADLGYRNWYDDRMWHLARAPLSSRALPILARTQVAYLASLAGRTRKCLVLDLDNTLWGGVLGEEGITGIELGDVYPGSAFQQFQKFLLQLFQR